MANNKISSSKREIYTKMLDIAEKYTDIKNTDFLKTGLFGYMTETMAMMMRDSTFHKNMIYNESFLNTAVLPRSVYNWAKMFNIEVQKAMPKYALIDIIIPTNKLKEKLNSNRTYNEEEQKLFGVSANEECIILNRNDPILAGDYYFSLERSIKIKLSTAKSIEGSQRTNDVSSQYTAEYVMTEPTTTNFETLSSKNLIVRIKNENLIISARAYQYQTFTTVSKITTTSFLNKIHKVSFEDQFCGVSLFYEEFNEYKEVPIFYSDIKNPTNKRCAFYNLTDSNELEIIFKHGDDYFMPSANSKLKICVYTTKGENAPLVYSGDAFMNISDNDLRTLPIVIQFNPSNLIGGKNQPDISTIKQTIIREISTRNVITTQSDLDNFFDILTSLIEDINDGKIKFIKKRDDIVKRVFNAYLLLRDNIDDSKEAEITNTRTLSQVVPTNTIDILFDDSLAGNDYIKLDYPMFDFNGQYIANGSDENNKYYTLINGDAVDNNYYMCPFFICLLTTGVNNINFVKYIYNMTDSESNVYFTENSSMPNLENFYIIPEKVSLYRGFKENNFKPTDYYTLSIITTTNVAIGSCPDADKVYGCKGSITIQETTGTNNSYTVNEDNISVRSELMETNLYKTTFDITINVDSVNEFYYNGSNDTQGNYFNKINLVTIDAEGKNQNVMFNPSSILKIDMRSLEIEGNPFNIELQTTDPLVFFEHLDKFMDSDMFMSENNCVGLKDVPVIHSSFFNRNGSSEERKENFVKQLFTYIEILKKNTDRLETSTFFNIKFYNTYGPSRLYQTTDINIKLGLKIIFRRNEYLQNKNLQAEIRSYIRKLVDKMNNEEEFNYTKLISSISNQSTYGKYIKDIQFIGLNGALTQHIYRLKDRDEQDFTPEWLNVDYNSLHDEGSGESIYFVYE